MPVYLAVRRRGSGQYLRLERAWGAVFFSCLSLNMTALSFSEASENFYQSMRRDIPEDL